MGESSAPRRPTHDTNTSRKHTHTYQQQQQQQQHFIKYKHTMKFTGLIASTLMLLVFLMASTASARSIAFPEPQYCCNAIEAKCEACKAGVSVEEICRTWVVDSSDPFSYKSRPLPGCPTEQPPICCNAYNAKCEACKFGITVEEMCRVHEEDMALDSHLQPLQGCPKKPKKCCRANTLECQACNAGVSEEEFCRRNPHSHVCPQKKQCCRAFTLSAKLVTPVYPKRNSAEGTLTHMSALRSLPNHLILITATPRFGTRK